MHDYGHDLVLLRLPHAWLQDLLRAVYPSATRADCQRMTALVQKPEARPLSTRRSVQQQVVNIAKAFAACDADGSGALDLAEFTEAMAELGGELILLKLSGR